jgi:hypothetical protein
MVQPSTVDEGEHLVNIALWIAAGFVAVILLVSSAMLFVSKEKMAGMGDAFRWVEDFSPGFLKASEPLSSWARWA